MNDESIDVNISFINNDYFSISVRIGYCTEYSTAGKEKLRIIEEKKGYRI